MRRTLAVFAKVILFSLRKDYTKITQGTPKVAFVLHEIITE